MATQSDDDRRQKQLRLVAAMLETDADCARIVSRDFQDLGVDPREPLVFQCCKTHSVVLEDLIANTPPGLEWLSSGACSPNCPELRPDIYTICPYELAAARGHIDVLCTLPARYGDIVPRDQCPPTEEDRLPVSQRPNDDVMTSHPDDEVILPLQPSEEMPSECTEERTTSRRNDEVMKSQHVGKASSLQPDDKVMTSKASNEMASQPRENVNISGRIEATKDISKPTPADSRSGVIEHCVQCKSECTCNVHDWPQNGEESRSGPTENTEQSLQSVPCENVSGNPVTESSDQSVTDRMQAPSDPEMSSSVPHAAKAPSSPQATPPIVSTATAGVKASEHSKGHEDCACGHNNRSSCTARRDIVISAVKQYVAHHSVDPEKLAHVLRCQPCSEDVIDVFDVLANLPAIKAGLDISCLVQEFGAVSGAHSRRTPLMSACYFSNVALLQAVLTLTDVDVHAKDVNNRCVVFHLEDDGTGTLKTMMAILRNVLFNQSQPISPKPKASFRRTYSYDFLPEAEIKAQDEGHPLRKDQSRLCQLAWNPFCDEDAEDELELSPLFDQEITIRCCLEECQMYFFPRLVCLDDSREPPVIFSEGCTDYNTDLFLSIERGECPCESEETSRKPLLSFLPACAAAVAPDGIDLFRRMFESFVTRVEREHGAGGQGQGQWRQEEGGGGKKSALKKERYLAFQNYDSEPEQEPVHGCAMSTMGKLSARRDPSAAAFSSGDRVAQVLRHLIYAKRTPEALRVLDDPRVQNAFHLTGDSRVSLLDLALRLQDEDTFRELVDRFGLDSWTGSYGMTPLLLAISWGRVALARDLIRRGGVSLLGAQTRRGSDAFRIAFNLGDEVTDEMVLMLLQESESQSDQQDLRVPSTLELAAQFERYTILDYLLERGQRHVPQVPSHRTAGSLREQAVWSPVVAHCCVCRSYPAARYLIEKGEDCFTPAFENPHNRNSDTRTPLQALMPYGTYCTDAVVEKALSMVDLLMEKGADVNEKTLQGYTPLVLAMKSSNVKVLGKLICAGAILDSLQPSGSSENEGAESTLNVSGSTSTLNASGSISTQNVSGSRATRDGFLPSALQSRFRGVDETKDRSFLWHAVETEHYKVAEMAVVGGYRAHREEWFVNRDFPDNTPQDVMDSLERLCNQPMTLISLCRRALRESVGTGLPAYLLQLQHRTRLPQTVADFIAMMDLVDTYLKPAEVPS